MKTITPKKDAAVSYEIAETQEGFITKQKAIELLSTTPNSKYEINRFNESLWRDSQILLTRVERGFAVIVRTGMSSPHFLSCLIAEKEVA